MENNNVILLSCVLFLSACNMNDVLSELTIGVPTNWKVYYKESQLGNNDIGKFVKYELDNKWNNGMTGKKFINTMNDDLKVTIKKQLPDNYLSSDLKDKMFELGFICNENNQSCEYQGYIVVKRTSFGKVADSYKQIFTISLNYQQGLDTLEVSDVVKSLSY